MHFYSMYIPRYCVNMKTDFASSNILFLAFFLKRTETRQRKSYISYRLANF